LSPYFFWTALSGDANPCRNGKDRQPPFAVPDPAHSTMERVDPSSAPLALRGRSHYRDFANGSFRGVAQFPGEHGTSRLVRGLAAWTVSPTLSTAIPRSEPSVARHASRKSVWGKLVKLYPGDNANFDHF
jgi:hypothetical protein